MRALLIALCLVTSVGVVHAQRTPEQRRENIKKKIRALRAYTLTEQLSLDEATAGKLFPILAKWDDVVDKLLVTRSQLAQQLADPDGKDPKVLSKAIDDSVANQRGLWDVEEKRLAELRKILTPAQTAKLLTVLPQFERRLQNQLRRAIEGKGGKGNGTQGRRKNVIDTDEDWKSNPYDNASAPDDDGDVPEGMVDPFSTKHGGKKGNTGGELGGNPYRPSKNSPYAPSQAPGATKPKCDPFAQSHCP